MKISGPCSIQGAIIIKSPEDSATIQINSAGSLNYNPVEVSKTIFDLPFLIQAGTKHITRLKEHEFDSK